MKVLHINTIDYGGAAIAALRLHKSMLELGIDSTFLSLKKTTSDITNHIIVPEFLNKTANNQKISIKNYLKIKLDLRLRRHNKELSKKRILRNLASSINREIISFPQTEFNLLHLMPEINQADIIHLHWVADFIDYTSFFKNISKPIIWTLHDENPFRGIFHYASDEDTNTENKLREADIRAYSLKIEAVKRSSKLHIITPSSWLASLASSRDIFDGFKVSVVNNGLDTTIFKVHNKEFARRILNLPI